MELWQIKEHLNSRAEEVCSYLLSAGVKVGNRWTCGDVHNTPPKDKRKGGSLIIDLTGAKVGRWKDFQSSEGGGSLIDLWMACRSVDFKTALGQIREHFNLGEPERVQRKASPENKWERTSLQKREAEPPGERQDLGWLLQPLAEGSKVWKWLTVERGISPETLSLYRVGQYVRKDKETGAEQHFAIFPFYNHDNEWSCKCRESEP